MSIDHFDGRYGWLTSRYLCNIRLPELPDRLFPTADHVHWGLIYTDMIERFSVPTEWDPKAWLAVPSANDINRECTRRLAEQYKYNRTKFDPREFRIDAMRRATLLKFDQHPNLKEMLVKTNGQELRYFNTWKDLFWGCEATPDGAYVGANWLGRILMDLRSKYLEEAG